MRPLRALVSLAVCLLLLLPVADTVGGTSNAEAGAAPLIRLDDVDLDRLVSLARLWSTVEYFHPWLAYRDVDWEGALLEAIPRILEAEDADAHAAALDDLLETLGDPVTRLLAADGHGSSQGTALHGPAPGEEAALVRSLGEGTVLLDLRDYARLQNWSSALRELRAVELDGARAVLVDLRPLPGQERFSGIANFVFGVADVAPRLVTEPVTGPGQRHRSHLGFAPWSGTTSGGYQSVFRVVDGVTVEPADDARDLPVAFLVNPHADLPGAALALQSAGRAVIVAEEGLAVDGLVNTHEVDLGEGLRARIRLGELVAADGSGGVAADLVVASGQDPVAAARQALDRLQAGGPRSSQGTPLPAHGRRRVGDVDASEPYPGHAERLLAGIRIWSVIDLFFPYRDLMEDDWDRVLRESLPRLAAAADAAEYHRAVAAMYAHIRDTHGSVRSPVLSEVFGAAPTPVRVRWIESRPVVTGFWNAEAAEIAAEAGVEVGDVVLEVDGSDAVERTREMTRYIAASTEHALMGRAVSRALMGAEGSDASLLLESPSGRRTVQLPRSRGYYRGAAARSGDVLRMLNDDVGYADLDRLQPSRVPEMFERFRDTRAIVFDMRGYPNGTAWAIAPYLSEEPAVEAALFERPWLLGPTARDRQTYRFRQRIPAPGPDVFHYPGRTVMLVDERTISQAEHTGLFFEAANGTVFIGSPSNGANGDVTNFSVPGGIRLGFTGQSVRHADGRQLQRRGLQPAVEVRPTIAGLRAGRDEVLEAAIDYLEGDRP